MFSYLRALLAATAIFALAGLPANSQEIASGVSNPTWLDELEPLKSDESKRAEAIQGCILDLYAQGDDWQSRQTISGLLEVSNTAAYKVFCRAFVHAFVSDRLVAQDFEDLMDKDDVSTLSRAAGRVLREVYYAHRELMHRRAREDFEA